MVERAGEITLKVEFVHITIQRSPGRSARQYVNQILAISDKKSTYSLVNQYRPEPSYAREQLILTKLGIDSTRISKRSCNNIKARHITP